MAGKGAEFCAAHDIPQHSGLIDRPGNCQPTIARKRDGVDAVRVTKQAVDFGTRGGIPDARGFVLATREQVVAVGRNIDREDPAGMAAESADLGSRGRVPQQGALILTARDDEAAARPRIGRQSRLLHPNGLTARVELGFVRH